MKLVRTYEGRVQIVRSGGSRGTTLFPWFKNRIVDTGLDAIGIGHEFLTYCKVGLGNTAVTDGDTDLASPLAIVSGTTHSTGASNTAPYYGWVRRKFSFLPGTATGPLKELGIFWSPTGMFARALIKDDLDAPTEIDIQEDEQIDVYYDLRSYAPSADSAPAIIDLSGDGSGANYTFVSRASYASNVAYWRPYDSDLSMHYSNVQLCSGTIGAVTSRPSGSNSVATNSLTPPSYVPGSFQRKFRITWDQTVTISANALWMQSSIGTFQMSVSPAIVKNDLNRLELEFTFEWARHA